MPRTRSPEASGFWPSLTLSELQLSWWGAPCGCFFGFLFPGLSEFHGRQGSAAHLLSLTFTPVLRSRKGNFVISSLQVEGWCDPLKVTESAVPLSDVCVLNAFKTLRLPSNGNRSPPPFPEDWGGP